ncbi:MAG: TerB family tellurite resistance protein [Bacteroidales bacterium]|nr:TerB family tellurite resistance protein [Bacteroidales bacterium]
MAKYGKWIAGGLGWAFFGPIGGILGFVVGSMVESSSLQSTIKGKQTTTGGFAMTLLVLVAAVMKADGKITKSELNYVREYFNKSFGLEAANEAILLLKDLLKQDIPVDDVCRQIKQNLDYSSKLQLLHLLFNIADADGEIHPNELKLIGMISNNLGLSQKDYKSILAMFYDDIDSAYNVLEINKNVSNDEIKTAYRKMATKYHPDKVSYLGEDFQKIAHEKFQKVNEAYKKIKKERKIA